MRIWSAIIVAASATAAVLVGAGPPTAAEPPPGAQASEARPVDLATNQARRPDS